MKTGLKVVSMLELIIGIVILLFGLINIVLFAAGDGAGVSVAVLFVAGDGAGDSVAGLLMLSLFLLILNGIFDIICGILGLRAANHPSKAAPAVIFGGIALILAVISLIRNVSIAEAVSCIIPVLYFIFALNVKKG